MATYGYTRVSTAEQATGLSLDEQQRRIEGIALMRRASLDRLFVEEGITGSRSLETRPLGRDLCAALRPGDTLIVAKLDRAFRNAADALSRAEAWRRQGIGLIVADMGGDPVTDNGVAKMFFGMLALVAEFERDRILERTNEGRRAKAIRGGHIGGSPPFGFRVQGSGKTAQLVQIAEEQKAIKTIAALAGRSSLREIAKAVHERHNIKISHEAVRRILTERSAKRWPRSSRSTLTARLRARASPSRMRR